MRFLMVAFLASVFNRSGVAVSGVTSFSCSLVQINSGKIGKNTFQSKTQHCDES